jgi:PhnB protein
MKHQPPEYHSITPYLVMTNCSEAIEFYTSVLGAKELFRTPSPEPGQIDHAELEIGDSRMMVADAHPGSTVMSPQTLGGTTVSFVVYVPDVDSVFQAALVAGAVEDDPVKDKPYGDRSGTIIDPFGHRWTIATHLKDVSPQEVERL